MAQLSRSFDTTDIAERQWRETRGLIAILMVLLAIPLSRTNPRHGRLTPLFPLTLLFIVTFYAGNICRSLVASGLLPAFPGLWVIPLLLLLIWCVLITREYSLLQKYCR